MSEPQKRSRPRFTSAELRVLRDMLFLKKNGHYDAETNRWVYDTDIYEKLGRMLAARKPREAKVAHA